MNNDNNVFSKKIIISNWKMNNDLKYTQFFLKQIIKNYSKKQLSKIEIGIAISFPFLFIAKKIVKEYPINIFAQNIHHMDYGSYTGEVSANMLKSININNVILGHSERRTFFNEDDNILLKKINMAINNKFKKIIICIGENENERNKKIYFDIIKEQIKNTIFKIDKNYINNIIIAYEPIWSIGSGKNAEPSQIEEIHSYIRNIINNNYNSFISNNIKIIYGGSITNKNIDNIINKKNVDGVLIGKYSLIYEDYINLINKYIIKKI